MATIESLTAAIRAALDKASECLAGLAGSKELTESLRDRLQGLGFENTATGVSGIAAELEAAQAQATTIVDRLESALAAIEAAREHGASRGGGSASRGSEPPQPPPKPVYPYDRSHGISWSDLHHVLNGDPDDPRRGGHAFGTGRPGKTEFPESWDEVKIRNALAAVADRPVEPDRRPNGNWYADGVVEGVTVRAVIRPDGSIAAGWPLKGPGVRTNPR